MTEAQKRAQKKYDEAHKKDFRIVQLKLNRETDADKIFLQRVVMEDSC